jgi:hypothetical protein
VAESAALINSLLTKCYFDTIIAGMECLVFIGRQVVTLAPAQLIQSGGEGMVFGLDGVTAVKRYHRPGPKQAAKLQAWLDSGLVAQLPAHILGPRALVHNEQGEVIGFQMARLPAGAQPLKQLANLHFRQKQQIEPEDVVALFRQLHTTLTHLHQHGVIVGDLNDQNIFFALSPALPRLCSPAFVDVDSYQFGRFPCPVAMQPFLDPQLYRVGDFSQRPFFTEQTDWYAFFVLLVKSLLGVHPYGGAHHTFKSLQARAMAGVSVLDPAVIYPTNALPLDTLSGALRHHLRRVFEQGERPPFPLRLLDMAVTPRLSCPLSLPPPPGAPDIDGLVEYQVTWPDGRTGLIARRENQYRLVWLAAGNRREMVLFDGRPGYRFALFGRHLAVNPPSGAQLLILDVGGAQPRKVALVETALFRESAVFAATPRHLYRIAGAMMMRGRVQDGMYVEDVVATAHRSQTQFWASSHGETVAGYHRIFADYRLFVLHEGVCHDVPVPSLAPGESVVETAFSFEPDAVIFRLKVGQRDGRLRTVTCSSSL